MKHKSLHFVYDLCKYVHVVISVDFLQYGNIKLISAKFLESAVFWHMTGEANKNMDISQQIFTFSSGRKYFYYCRTRLRVKYLLFL